MIIGNAASIRQENAVVDEGTNDRDFAVGSSSSNTAINENVLNVKTQKRCFNERIDREMSNIVDTVEDRIQNAILTAIENIVAPKIELAIRSMNASSGRNMTSVTSNSERGEHVGIDAPFENASENNMPHASNINDETRHNIQDEVSELSVSGTHFDRQAHTHHNHYHFQRVGPHGTKPIKLEAQGTQKRKFSNFLVMASCDFHLQMKKEETNPRDPRILSTSRSKRERKLEHLEETTLIGDEKADEKPKFCSTKPTLALLLDFSIFFSKI